MSKIDWLLDEIREEFEDLESRPEIGLDEAWGRGHDEGWDARGKALREALEYRRRRATLGIVPERMTLDEVERMIEDE